ncbi:hypothetical protein BDW72DRAFT_175333 [Aspergillus terricola var. indicus]
MPRQDSLPRQPCGLLSLSCCNKDVGTGLCLGSMCSLHKARDARGKGLCHFGCGLGSFLLVRIGIGCCRACIQFISEN